MNCSGNFDTCKLPVQQQSGFIARKNACGREIPRFADCPPHGVTLPGMNRAAMPEALTGDQAFEGELARESDQPQTLRICKLAAIA